MKSRKGDRIVFYSKEDMSSGYHLEKVEGILKYIDLNREFEINDLLEFYNIKQYFNNDLFFFRWDDLEKEKFKTIINEANEKIQKKWLGINNENILSYLDELEFDYWNSFWELVSRYQVYKKIDEKQFALILRKYPYRITNILSIKNLVDQFNIEIRCFLLDYDKTAELLLSKSEEENSNNSKYYNFPRSLSLNDRENIINNYIESEHVNLNYVRLIEKSKDSAELRISPYSTPQNQTTETAFIVENSKAVFIFAWSSKADKGSAGEHPFRNSLILLE